jgi:hypothetical protein
MIVLVHMFAVVFQRAMLMHVKDANEREHEEEPYQCRDHRAIDAADHHRCVRNQMQQSYAKHEPADQAHHELHPGVRQPHHAGKPSTRERRRQDHEAIQGEQSNLHGENGSRSASEERQNSDDRLLQNDFKCIAWRKWPAPAQRCDLQLTNL